MSVGKVNRKWGGGGGGGGGGGLLPNSKTIMLVSQPVYVMWCFVTISCNN